MYSINLIPRKVLITPDEIVRRVRVDPRMDPRMLLHSIELAEERLVVPVLGFALYQDLVEKKNVLVTSTNISDLQALVDAGFSGEQETPTLQVGQYVNATELMLNPDDVALWDMYLCKFVAEAVRWVALPDIYVQLTSSGIMKNNPAVPSPLGGDTTKVASADLKDLQYLVANGLEDRISPLQAALRAYLCRSRAKYPKFDPVAAGCDPCAASGTSLNDRKTALINIYEDEDRGRCGCKDW